VGAASLPRLGGGSEERAAFDRWIAPHYDENQFADMYFAGMHNPRIEFRVTGSAAVNPTFSWYGTLIDPATGNPAGWISRSISPAGWVGRLIDPDSGSAWHDGLQLDSPGGLGKVLLRGQIDIYQNIGIDRVGLSAGDVGAYAWAKYGWLPQSVEEWRNLKKGIKTRMEAMAQEAPKGQPYGRIDPEDRRDVLAMLRSNRPSVIWGVADLTTPTGGENRGGRPLTLGKALLLDQKWRGTLDLNNPRQMRRFDDYVGKK
jgi:hypothetical protein